MSKREDIIETVARIMEDVAADDSHGYDQAQRWGERGDYDCSSLIITAWQFAGVPVRASGASYTGNMRPVFLRCGFRDVRGEVNLSTGEGLQRGDVLLNTGHHTALYLGNGKEAEANINELGGITGGKPGDQTGREILVRAYRNFPWDCVLRYEGDEGTAAQPAKPAENVQVSGLPIVQRGSRGAAVAACQGALKYKGCNPVWIDGDAGAATEKAIRKFQTQQGIEEDGVCGPETWAKLLN